MSLKRIGLILKDTRNFDKCYFNRKYATLISTKCLECLIGCLKLMCSDQLLPQPSPSRSVTTPLSRPSGQTLLESLPSRLSLIGPIPFICTPGQHYLQSMRRTQPPCQQPGWSCCDHRPDYCRSLLPGTSVPNCAPSLHFVPHTAF